MKFPLIFPKFPAALVLALAGSGSLLAFEGSFVSAITVYSAPDSAPTVAYEVPSGGNYVYYSPREYGDDVELEGTDRVIAGLSLEYYSNYALDDGLTIRLYEADSNGQPGDLIYTTSADILNGGAYLNVGFAYDLGNVLPDSLVYTVQFSGFDGTHQAGLIAPDEAPTTGASSGHFLEKRGQAWLEMEFSGTFRGRRLGVIRNGNILKFKVEAEPNASVPLEGTASLNGNWEPVGAVETDAEGVGEFDIEIGATGMAFYRTAAE